MVTIRVFGLVLLPCVEEPEIQCEISAPVSVRELLEGNPETLGGLMEFLQKSELMVTVNQKVSTLESKIKDGDEVKLTHQFNPEHEGALWHNP
jgi:molybdopterin converting factor small subunit